MFKDIWIFVPKEKTFEKAVFICLHNDFAIILKDAAVYLVLIIYSLGKCAYVLLFAGIA